MVIHTTHNIAFPLLILETTIFEVSILQHMLTFGP